MPNQTVVNETLDKIHALQQVGFTRHINTSRQQRAILLGLEPEELAAACEILLAEEGGFAGIGALAGKVGR